MNAIISLCHFCENHGPSVIFCTYPHRPGDYQQATSVDNVSDSEITQPRMVSPTESTTRTRRPDTCEGCYSLNGGYVSHDEEAAVSYVSKQYPHHPLVYSMVRQACVRSLSCEVCPGREGPIFFGDDERGHVLSYTFYIADSHSRGLQRWYSILVIMMDKVYLLNSWPFLVSNLQLVIDHVQSKAKHVYDHEQAKCPQKPLRLQTGMTPANFRQQRGVSKSPRSLIELTDDKNIFKLFHVSFTWIIKACGSRIKEMFLEGPPTQDAIIDMEKQEETEEGFIKLFSKKLDTTDTGTVINDEIGEVMPPKEPRPQTTPVQVLRQLRQIFGPADFRGLIHQTIIGNQIVVRGDEPFIITSILESLKVLIPTGCCRIIWHSDEYKESWQCNLLGLSITTRIPTHILSDEHTVLINVKKKAVSFMNSSTSSQKTIKTLVDSAEEQYININIIPKTDSDVCTSRTEKKNSFQKIVISETDIESDYTNIEVGNIECSKIHYFNLISEDSNAVDEIKKNDGEDDKEVAVCETGAAGGTSGDQETTGDDNRGITQLSAFDDYEFDLNLTKFSAKAPHVLTVIESAIQNDGLTNEVVEQVIMCLKKEWMNKVKVLFKFTKAGGGRSEEDTKKLIQVVGANSEDMPLLKFWMTGLSVQYRTQVRSSSKQVPVT